MKAVSRVQALSAELTKVVEGLVAENGELQRLLKVREDQLADMRDGLHEDRRRIEELEVLNNELRTLKGGGAGR